MNLSTEGSIVRGGSFDSKKDGSSHDAGSTSGHRLVADSIRLVEKLFCCLCREEDEEGKEVTTKGVQDEDCAHLTTFKNDACNRLGTDNIKKSRSSDLKSARVQIKPLTCVLYWRGGGPSFRLMRL